MVKTWLSFFGCSFNRDKDDKLEPNKNEGAIGIVENKGCLRVDFQVNESYVTNNRVQMTVLTKE